jgi:V/A-type H+-transporting ATPase subunit E
MAEELQSLLDRIQKDAVDTADEKAKDIVKQAKEKAASIVKEAEEQAAENLKKADEDAKAFTERSHRTLEQASRDLLITIGEGVDELFKQLVNQALKESMDDSVLQEMLVKIAAGFAEGREEITVMLNDEDRKKLSDFFTTRFKDQVKQGVEVCTDSEIVNGFKVAFKGSDVYNDFTQEAIAESLMNFLRPQLAEIVHNIAEKQDKE